MNSGSLVGISGLSEGQTENRLALRRFPTGVEICKSNPITRGLMQPARGFRLKTALPRRAQRSRSLQLSATHS